MGLQTEVPLIQRPGLLLLQVVASALEKWLFWGLLSEAGAEQGAEGPSLSSPTAVVCH